MKRLLVMLSFVMFVLPVLAVSVCAKNDVVTVVLDPTLAVSSYEYNNATGVWKAKTSYGTVTGISTCLASGGTQYKADPSVDAKGGETLGSYCWCKMTHPMASAWVFGNSYVYCSTSCTYYCGFYFQNYSALRSGLFGSVGN